MNKPKIAIIDDDPDIVKSITVVLETEGYQVYSADNKDDGFKLVKDLEPDLIILDVMMEKMCDGFDLARQLKDNNQYKNIPIIMLTAVRNKTGFTFSSVAGDEVWLPVEEYIEKPVSPHVLVAKIKQLLSDAEKK